MIATSSSHDLWTRMRSERDRSARDEIIVRYAHLVKYVVGRMAISLPAILDSEDILGHGTVGLINAVDRFDPSQGVKFETYAIQRIRGSILDALRALNILPRSAGQRVRELEAAYARLQQRLFRSPTEQEVAAELGVSSEELARALSEASCTIVSLDHVISPGDDGEQVPLRDLVEDRQSPNPVDYFERLERHGLLVEAIEGLSERERLVIALYYQEELTLREISRVLEVSESRVSQIHTAIILKLRAALRAERAEALPKSGSRR